MLRCPGLPFSIDQRRLRTREPVIIVLYPSEGVGSPAGRVRVSSPAPMEERSPTTRAESADAWTIRRQPSGGARRSPSDRRDSVWRYNIIAPRCSSHSRMSYIRRPACGLSARCIGSLHQMPTGCTPRCRNPMPEASLAVRGANTVVGIHMRCVDVLTSDLRQYTLTARELRLWARSWTGRGLRRRGYGRVICVHLQPAGCSGTTPWVTTHVVSVSVRESLAYCVRGEFRVGCDSSVPESNAPQALLCWRWCLGCRNVTGCVVGAGSCPSGSMRLLLPEQ